MIVFTTPTNNHTLYMAFNNHIIRFYSNNTAAALYAEISGLIDDVIRLYPSPDNRFFFNFKPYVSALINRGNFEDTVQPDIIPAEPDSFVYNVAGRVFLQRPVSIKIFLPGEVQDVHNVTLSWLAGVQQLGDTAEYAVNDTLVLSPYQKNTLNSYYLKYWQGYPFDIPFYSGLTGFTLKNETIVTPWQEFPSLGGFGTRLFLSDGRTDESLEDVLPMATGFNRLRLMRGDEASDGDLFINLEKMPYKCGVYLKWLNAMGGYSYWLFEDTYSIDRSTKQLGELDRDNDNLADTFARTTQIGKESTDTLKIVVELLTEDESRIVQGMLDSPKIYLFTGKPYAQNGYRNWVEVMLKTPSARIKNPRQPLTNFAFDIEMSTRYTQTL